MWILYVVNFAIFLGFIILAWKKPGIALILLLPVATGMFFSGLINEDIYRSEGLIVIYTLAVILLPISISVIHWGPSSSRLETPWYRAVTGAILTIFKYLVILALFVLVFQFFSPILFMLFLVGSYQFAQAQKFGLAVDVISTIGTSIRQSLPLPMALTTAAYGQKKKQARIFNNIAHWLTQGWPLSEALRRGYPKCPSNILASIIVAEKMNQLPKAIELLQVDLSEKVNDYKVTRPVEPLYPFVVLSILFLIMMGLCIFIFPTFAEVLSDMSDGKEGLPAATQSLLNFSSWMTARKGLNALMIFVFILIVIYMVLHIRNRRRRPEKPRLLSRIGDRITWHTPVLHWFEKTFANLYFVQSLRVGLLAGYPMNTILKNALGLDINRCYQERLEKWLDKIEAGDNIAQSAKACGLDKALYWALDEKVNKGNAPQILEGLEEVYRNQYNYRKNVLAAATEPLIILCLGLCVGWVVYAMFIAILSTITVTLQYTIPQ